MQENYESVDNAGQMSFPDGTNPESNADGSAEAHYYDQMAYSKWTNRPMAITLIKMPKATKMMDLTIDKQKLT